MAEESPSDDVVVWAVQLEKEWFADLEILELAVATRLPEVDLIEPINARKVIEPIAIGDTDVEAHALSRGKGQAVSRIVCRAFSISKLLLATDQQYMSVAPAAQETEAVHYNPCSGGIKRK